MRNLVKCRFSNDPPPEARIRHLNKTQAMPVAQHVVHGEEEDSAPAPTAVRGGNTNQRRGCSPRAAGRFSEARLRGRASTAQRNGGDQPEGPA